MTIHRIVDTIDMALCRSGSRKGYGYQSTIGLEPSCTWPHGREDHPRGRFAHAVCDTNHVVTYLHLLGGSSSLRPTTANAAPACVSDVQPLSIDSG
jgi:hypothetical protein